MVYAIQTCPCCGGHRPTVTDGGLIGLLTGYGRRSSRLTDARMALEQALPYGISDRRLTVRLERQSLQALQPEESTAMRFHSVSMAEPMTTWRRD